jgi:hypothetical protein
MRRHRVKTIRVGVPHCCAMTDVPPPSDQPGEMPRFPEHLMTTVKRTMVWQFQNADISTEQELQMLLQRMFDLPEHTFEIFLQKSASLTDVLCRATQGTWSDIHVTQTDLRFFRWPVGTDNYMQIRSGDAGFQWLQEAVKHQEYIRFTLRLSERKRRQMEVEQHLAAHAKTNNNPLLLQPNFYGVGLSLPKAWKWLVTRIRR